MNNSNILLITRLYFEAVLGQNFRAGPLVKSLKKTKKKSITEVEDFGIYSEVNSDNEFF